MGEAEAPQDARGPRLGGMGIDIDQSCMDFGNAVSVGLGLGGTKQAGPLGIGVQHHIEHALAGRGRFLRDRADPRLGMHLDITVVGQPFVHDQAEQGGLARPVAADESGFRSGGYDDARLVEKHAVVDLEIEIGDREHRSDWVGRASGAWPGVRH